MTILWITLAGGLGAVLRYGTDVFVRTRHKKVKFPAATVVINIIGCFLIGAFTGAHLVHAIGYELSAILTTGFCGGYSTLSLVTVETINLKKKDAIFNILLQMVLPLLATVLGMYLGLTI